MHLVAEELSWRHADLVKVYDEEGIPAVSVAGLVGLRISCVASWRSVATSNLPPSSPDTQSAPIPNRRMRAKRTCSQTCSPVGSADCGDVTEETPPSRYFGVDSFMSVIRNGTR